MATKKKPKVSQKVEAKRLGRNVTSRNTVDAIKSSDDYRKLLTDPEREAEAAELIRRHAIEADPSKPGYEANEVVAPIVRAFTQLPSHRRAALLELAGNPELFANLPNGYDPIGQISDADKGTLLEEKIAAMVQPTADTADVGVDLSALARSPATFAGTKFASNNKIDSRAAIDRTIPGVPVDPVTGMQSDPKTGKLPELTPEQEKARVKNIREIVGLPMWQQVQAAMENALEPVLPEFIPEGTPDRLYDERGLLYDNGRSDAQQEESLVKKLARLNRLPIDPEVDPLGHVSQPGAHADELDEFSDAKPTAFPSESAKADSLQRAIGQLSDLRGRQAAFLETPSQPAILHQGKLSPITIGTLGLQEPYQPSRGRGSMTVDRQLDRSARSERDRIIEAIYRASLADSTEPVTGDVSDFGKDDLLRQTDIRQRPGGLANTINLDALVPQWRYQYPVKNAAGEFEYPAYAPSASFLADQMIGWHGIEDPDAFRKSAIPVLEGSIKEQYNTLPQTQRAIKAAMTRLVPGIGPNANGRKFFTAPGVEDYMEGMFDKRYPMTQFTPKHFSQDARGSLEMPQEYQPVPDGVLDELLNEPSGSMPQEIDLDALLREPPEGDELSKTMNRNRSGLLQGLYA